MRALSGPLKARMKLRQGRGGIGEPPRRLIRYEFYQVYQVVLWCLLLLSAALLVQAGLRENGVQWAPSSFVLLGVGEAVVLFVTLLSLMALRAQYNLSMKPILEVSNLGPHNKTLPQDETDAEVLTSELKNTGAGRAIISRCGYLLQEFGEIGDIPGERQALNHSETIERLRKLGFSEMVDFRLPRVAEHVCIQPGETSLLFEANASVLARVRLLDVSLTYESQVGHGFATELPCVPHHRTDGLRRSIERAQAKEATSVVRSALRPRDA